MSRWPLYNPALLPPAQASLAHCLRRPLAERLLALLRRIGDDGAPQHQLVLGAPGAGKTMLLRALQLAISHDPALSTRWLPLAFPEAQWDVARPADFWVNALEYLVIALRRHKTRVADSQATALAAAIEALPNDEAARDQQALALLGQTSDMLGRRFVLLVDTLDVVLERLKRDQWHVREVLSAEPRLLVIGTSARAIEATFRYDAAFYDFFQLHELRPLPRESLVEVLAQAHAADPLRRVHAFATHHPPSFSALCDLLGTQPRMLALLGLALDSHPASATASASAASPASATTGELALAVLDHLTPSLRARLEALAPQSQQVVHALAAAWSPVRPHELARKTRLAPNVISAQLHRLVQDGLVDKTALGARNGFLLADRIFQVWLLMRMGQPHRRHLLEALDHLVTRYTTGHLPSAFVAAHGLQLVPELRAIAPLAE